jgi:hypothetical protein
LEIESMIIPSPTPIIRNNLVIDRVTNVICRVVFVDSPAGTTWLCRLDDDSWPYSVRTEVLQHELDSESGRFASQSGDPMKRAIADELHAETTHLSPAAKRHIERWNLIAPLLEGENQKALLNKHTRRKLIASRLQQVKSTRQHLSDLLKLYWKCGMSFAALQTSYANCGGPGKRRTNATTKLGRPRIHSPGIGIIVTDDVRAHLAAGAKHFFRTHCTMEEAWDWVVEHYFATIQTDDQGAVAVKTDDDSKPTLAQLRYFIETEYSRPEIRKKVLGEKRWLLHERAITGWADGDIQGPGDRFHIDATVADVYLRSQFDRRRITGRPVIYFVVDSYSRMIVGIYVGYEGPSWVGAMMALVNVVTPKVDFCRIYGVKICEADWPARYLSKILQGDCGELKSTNVGKNITRNLRIDIVNVGTGRPDMQALVERRFGTVPANFREFAPGYVKPDFGERGARDYRLDSKLTLFEFTGLVIRAVIKHNYAPIEDKEIHPEMITDGLIPCPLDLWHWGIRNRSGSLHSASVDDVALNVMIPATARVTSKGIRFKGEYYSCSSAVEREWFAYARQHEWTVNISYDPRDLGTFYLRDPDLPNNYEICRPINRNSDRFGKSQFELEQQDILKKVNIAASENDRQAGRIKWNREMREAQREATAATDAADDPKASKAERLAAIRENRLAEKSVQREMEKFELQPAASLPIDMTSQEPRGSYAGQLSDKYNPLSLLRQLRSQREKNEKG